MLCKMKNMKFPEWIRLPWSMGRIQLNNNNNSNSSFSNPNSSMLNRQNCSTRLILILVQLMQCCSFIHFASCQLAFGCWFIFFDGRTAKWEQATLYGCLDCTQGLWNSGLFTWFCMHFFPVGTTISWWNGCPLSSINRGLRRGLGRLSRA